MRLHSMGKTARKRPLNKVIKIFKKNQDELKNINPGFLGKLISKLLTTPCSKVPFLDQKLILLFGFEFVVT